MESIPLLKYLTQSAAGSRRSMVDAIKQGRVAVNERIAEDFKHPVDPETDTVILEGRQISGQPDRTIYLMLHKPRGVITTTRDQHGRPHVLDLIPEQYKSMRLYPVGRLDKETTGLLLLTNDGELTHRLTHPRYEHEKEYLVAIKGTLKPGDRSKLTRGIELADGRTWPARLKRVRNNATFNYSIVIHEGRKRQVRRMFESLGYRVLALHRIRMGNLQLGTLQPGAVRELMAEELAALRRP